MKGVKVIVYLALFIAFNAALWWGVNSYQQWYQQTRLDAFLTTERSIVHGAAQASSRWISHRVASQGPNWQEQAEKEAFEHYILPLKPHPQSNVWLFHNGILHHGKKAPLSNSSQGKSITAIFDQATRSGADHLDELIQGLTLGSESTSWYRLGPGQDREYVAWSSIKIGPDIWTIGTSTPEQAILATTDVAEQRQYSLVAAIIISLTSLLFLLLAVRSLGRFHRQIDSLHAEIDDRSVVENELRENENRYRKLFTGSKAVQLILDARSGQIIDANAAACAYYGYHVEDMQRLKISDISTFTDEEVEAEQARARDEGRAYCLFKHRLATGQIRDVEVYSNPIRLEGRNLIFAIIHDVTERMIMEEQIKHLGSHDVLTDLPNRALLLDRLEVAIEKAKRYSQHIAVLFIDLDGFKGINDTLGHKTGDKLLQRVSVKLQLSIRKADTVARFGGDEFVIVLTEAGSRRDISRVAGKIQEAVKTPLLIGGEEVTVGCSLGISVYPQQGKTPEQLISEADQAMYIAKRRGGIIHFAEDRGEPVATTE